MCSILLNLALSSVKNDSVERTLIKTILFHSCSWAAQSEVKGTDFEDAALDCRFCMTHKFLYYSFARKSFFFAQPSFKVKEFSV